ncbi:MAG: protoglobin domain-containing protein [Planctomycetota bacterium]|jgi:signal transduction histidine kinase
MDGDASPGAVRPDPDPMALRQWRGIRAMRRTLGFGEHEEALVRMAGERLGPEIPKWVDRFYLRLLTDYTAMSVLRDDAMVIRLKRSLTAWFHEFFSLAYDETYERARSGIGGTHMRIGLPQYYMVTAMNGVRWDVSQSIARQYEDDPDMARDVLRAVHMLLDLELALMIEGYRRHSRRVSRRRDRAVFTERAAHRFAETTRNRIDSALCYLEIAGRSSGQDRMDSVAKARDSLLTLLALPQTLPSAEVLTPEEPRLVEITELCARALDDVSLPVQMTMHTAVEPTDLQAEIRPEALYLAMEELLQNATTHAGARNIHLRAHPSGETKGALCIEVRDDGVGWAPGVHDLEDLQGRGEGLGLAFCDLVADLHEGTVELFRAPEGGAGVRLLLNTARSEAED